MKAAKMTVAGVTYYLVFDGEAIAFYFGTQTQKISDAVEKTTKEG